MNKSIRCGDCTFYHGVNVGQGECRKNPPQVFVVPTQSGIQAVSQFPPIASDAGCGQFEAAHVVQVAGG